MTTGRRVLATGMTELQDRFVREYLIDLNATAAWIRAGGAPELAARMASKLMREGSITKIAISRAMAERSLRVGISQERILDEIGGLAFGDPRTLFREDGSLKAPHEYSLTDAKMIESVKTRRIVEIGVDPDNPGRQKLIPVEIQEVKLVPKTKPLEMLMRHLGMNNDKLDVTINLPLADRMAKARAAVGQDPGGLVDEDDDTVIEGEFEEAEDDEAAAEAALLKKLLGG
jgi:phage terminase small subunit